jgi:exodeoxyribonuclease VII large subunit
MQGVMTARSVMEALSRLRRLPDIDVAVITRGGGSGSDLSWFNSEPLGRAIARAPWPVISGIGHEVDFTLPDFIAHTRAKTPTHAASMLVDRVADAAGSIDACAANLASTVLPRLRTETFSLKASASLLMSGVTSLSMRAAGMLERNGAWLESSASRRISDAKGRLYRGTTGLVSRGVPSWLAGSARSLDRASERIGGASSTRLDIAGRRIDALSAVVSAREPARMMALGWAVVRNEEGDILRSVSSARIGARIGVQLRDGSITARTESLERAPEGPPDP